MAGRGDDTLRLLAEDAEDLKTVSAALQDAVVRVGDLDMDHHRRAFTAVVNRYRWEMADAGGRGQRVRAALHVQSVLGARRRGLNVDQPDAVANLLSVAFETDDEPPGGVLRLTFSGGGEIAFDVECLDITLVDVTRPWPARRRPSHDSG